MLLMHKWGHIVSAETTSACSRFSTKKQGVDQEKEDVTQVTPSLQGACTPGATNIWTGTPETRPETEPPQEKRAKREAGVEELEEGEITDSSDEEKEEEEEEGNSEENIPISKSCVGAKSPANDMMVKGEPAECVIVDDGINKHSDRSRDQCLKTSLGSTDDSSASRESAEVSMTKEDAVTESGPVHTRHCHDEDESANAAESRGLE